MKATEPKIQLIKGYQVNMVERWKCLWHSLGKDSHEDDTVYMDKSKMACFSSGIFAASSDWSHWLAFRTGIRWKMSTANHEAHWVGQGVPTCRRPMETEREVSYWTLWDIGSSKGLLDGMIPLFKLFTPCPSIFPCVPIVPFAYINSTLDISLAYLDIY